MAVLPARLRPSFRSTMFMPASRRTSATRATMPTRSSLRTTSIHRAMGNSMSWSSTMTILGSARSPNRVPDRAWLPPRSVMRFT